MNRFLRQLALFAGCLLLGFDCLGQPFTAETPLPEESGLLIGISVPSNPPPLNFSTISDYQNGVSVTHPTFRLSVFLGVAWSLEVRATTNLQSQSYQIPVAGIGLQSTNVGVRPEIFLSTTNQLLASGLANLFLNQNVIIRYRALGGSNFLQPAGNYTTTLVFTYAGL